MPAVSKPVEVDGRVLLDGGMVDAIPLKTFQQMGYERNVVVLTQPRDYYKTRSRVLIWLIRRMTKKYPKVAEVMSRRHEMYNEQLQYITEEERKGNTLLIYPQQPLRIGRTELSERKMRRAHGLGYKAAMEIMDKIKEFTKG